MAQDIVVRAGYRLPIPQFQKKDGTRTMIKSIIKRDGRVVLYDQHKIAAAILRAMEVSGEGHADDAARVANAVENELKTASLPRRPISRPFRILSNVN